MSKFSTPFLNKSPLEGAYTSGSGGMVYASNRQAFQRLQDDIVKGLGSTSKNTCKVLLERRNNGTITQSAYKDASKGCSKAESETKVSYDKAIDSGITPEQMEEVFKAGSLIGKSFRLG